MAFFDKLSNTISAAGKDGISKAKEWKDTAKISVDIKEREGSIQKMYRELGRAYYHDHKDDAESDYDQVGAIRAAFEEIAELKASMDEIRGVRRCPECGQVISQTARFCANCGAKCEMPAEPVEGDVVDTEDMADAEEAVRPDVEEEVSEAGCGSVVEDAAKPGTGTGCGYEDKPEE